MPGYACLVMPGHAWLCLIMPASPSVYGTVGGSCNVWHCLQARGLLWRQFKRSDVVYDALKKPFAKIDAGVFNLTEVRMRARLGCVCTHAPAQEGVCLPSSIHLGRGACTTGSGMGVG